MGARGRSRQHSQVLQDGQYTSRMLARSLGRSGSWGYAGAHRRSRPRYLQGSPHLVGGHGYLRVLAYFSQVFLGDFRGERLPALARSLWRSLDIAGTCEMSRTFAYIRGRSPAFVGAHGRFHIRFTGMFKASVYRFSPDVSSAR